VMVALTFASTMIRLVPGYGGIYWAEEVTRYVSVWVVFLGAGLGVRFGIHLNVDLLTSAVQAGVQRALVLTSLALMLIFEFVLVYYGTQLTISNYDQQSASLRLPMAYAYAAIPVGGALMLLETLRLLVLELAGRRPTLAHATL
jgi:TRAP-type C4-dicarboxylate transport system permease small subunit